MSIEAQSYDNSTVLITGSKGYIGNELKNYFNKVGCNLIVSEDDLSNKIVWEGLINKNIDYVFHLAAAEGKNKSISMNSLSAKYLLEVCVEKKCFPKIIYASSTNLFGNISTGIINESCDSYPISEYSSHKFLAENYFKYYYLNYKIHSIILRIPNIYGPVSNENNLIKPVLNFVINKALLVKRINLYKNKDCLRDYLYIEDAVKAFYLSGLVKNEHCDGSFYIIGSDFRGTIEDISEKIKMQLDNLEINLDNKFVLDPMEFRNFTTDSSKFKNISNWVCEVPIDEGIALTIDFLKKRNP